MHQEALKNKRSKEPLKVRVAPLRSPSPASSELDEEEGEEEPGSDIRPFPEFPSIAIPFPRRKRKKKKGSSPKKLYARRLDDKGGTFYAIAVKTYYNRFLNNSLHPQRTVGGTSETPQPGTQPPI